MKFAGRYDLSISLSNEGCVQGVMEGLVVSFLTFSYVGGKSWCRRDCRELGLGQRSM